MNSLAHGVKSPRDTSDNISCLEFETRTDLIRMGFIYTIMHSSKNNTYKFALARSLLDQCKVSTSINIKYSDIASDFFNYYWEQQKLELRHGPKNQPLKVLKIIKEEFDENYHSYSVDKIKNECIERVERCIKKIRDECFHDVVPRFEGDAENYLGMSRTSKRSKSIIYYNEEKAYNDSSNNKKIYPDKGLTLNPLAIEFLRNNYELLFQMVMFQWIKFLEKLNPKTTELVKKIDDTTLKREQGEFRDILIENFKCCFYCEKKSKKFHVDHVLPFTHFGRIGLWNLVLACRECNCKKSDKLPPIRCIENLERRNKKYRKIIPMLEESLQEWKEPDIQWYYDDGKRKGYPVWEGPPQELTVNEC